MVGAWFRLLINSVVVAAITVAAELGAGDALSIVRWDASSNGAWATLLTWVVFIYASAVFVGALIGRIALRRSADTGARVMAAVAAAVGAGLAIGLVWLPAGRLTPPTPVNPELVVAIMAAGGAVVGLILAVLALAARPIAAGVQAIIAWVWLLAIGAAVVGLTSHKPYPAPRPGVPDMPSLLPDAAWSGPRVMIAVTVVIALVTALVGRWRASSRFGVALSGFGGPVLVCAAYLIAGPGGTSAERATQTGPYEASLIAVAAGLVTSVIVALPARRGAKHKKAVLAPVPAPRKQPPVIAEAPPPEKATTEESAAEWLAPEKPVQPKRPDWATSSGAYARAYASTGAATSASRVEPTGPTGRGTGWDGDTLPRGLPEITTSTSDQVPSDAEPGGLYRGGAYTSATDASGPERAGLGAALARTTPPGTAAVVGPFSSPLMGQPPAEDPHESWLREVGSTGRHAAADDGSW